MARIANGHALGGEDARSAELGDRGWWPVLALVSALPFEAGSAWAQAAAALDAAALVNQPADAALLTADNDSSATAAAPAVMSGAGKAAANADLATASSQSAVATAAKIDPLPAAAAASVPATASAKATVKTDAVIAPPAAAEIDGPTR